MCLAVPGKIIKKDKNTVMVDYGKEKRRAQVLDGNLKRGDYVVVQHGIVVGKIPKKEALESIKTWKSVSTHHK